MLKTKAELLSVLRDMIDRIEHDDSMEGTITYIGEDFQIFRVAAIYRIGNSQGQGGMRIVEG